MEHILSGEEEIAREKSLQGGVVTIAASEIALHCVLLPALKKYRKAYPGIRIRISNQTTPQALSELKKGLADMALVTDPFTLPEGITARVLRKIKEVPVCSTAFSLATGMSLTDEQIEKYKDILENIEQLEMPPFGSDETGTTLSQTDSAMEYDCEKLRETAAYNFKRDNRTSFHLRV